MRTNSPHHHHAFLLGKPPYLAPPGLNTGGCRPIACGNTGSGYGYFAIAQYAYAATPISLSLNTARQRCYWLRQYAPHCCNNAETIYAKA